MSDYARLADLVRMYLDSLDIPESQTPDVLTQTAFRLGLASGELYQKRRQLTIAIHLLKLQGWDEDTLMINLCDPTHPALRIKT